MTGSRIALPHALRILSILSVSRALNPSFPYAFALHVHEDRYDIRTVQEFLGHKDIKTTMIYTHVLNKGPAGVRSPADML